MAIDECLINFLDCDIPGFNITVKNNTCEDLAIYYIKFTKRKQLALQLHRMYWIIGRKSKLSVENKLLIHKTILKPIWTYGIPLWGTARNSNIEILQRFKNKVFRSIANAPRYVPNTVLHIYLQIPTVKAEMTNFSTRYPEKLITHPNELVPAPLEDEEQKD